MGLFLTHGQEPWQHREAFLRLSLQLDSSFASTLGSFLSYHILFFVFTLLKCSVCTIKHAHFKQAIHRQMCITSDNYPNQNMAHIPSCPKFPPVPPNSVLSTSIQGNPFYYYRLVLSVLEFHTNYKLLAHLFAVSTTRLFFKPSFPSTACLAQS